MPTTNVAITDVGTKFYVETAPDAGTYKILVPVTSVPATGQAPSTIDVTELDSPIKQYVLDRVDPGTMEFAFNDTEEKYNAVLAVCDNETHNFLIVYQDGRGVKITGTASCWHNELSAGTALGGGLAIAASVIEDIPSADTPALITGE